MMVVHGCKAPVSLLGMARSEGHIHEGKLDRSSDPTVRLWEPVSWQSLPGLLDAELHERMNWGSTR